MAQTIPVRVGTVDMLMEVTPVAGTQPTSAADRLANHLATAFDRAQHAIEEVAVSAARTVGRVAERAGRPDQMEVEFGVKVSAKGDVVLVGTAAEASLKVKIIYGSAAVPSAAEQVEETGAPES